MKITTCAPIVPCVPCRHQHVVMTLYFNIAKTFTNFYVPFNVPTTWCACVYNKHDLAWKYRYSMPINRVPVTKALNLIYIMYVHTMPLTPHGVISKVLQILKIIKKVLVFYMVQR